MNRVDLAVRFVLATLQVVYIPAINDGIVVIQEGKPCESKVDSFQKILMLGAGHHEN